MYFTHFEYVRSVVNLIGYNVYCKRCGHLLGAVCLLGLGVFLKGVSLYDVDVHAIDLTNDSNTPLDLSGSGLSPLNLTCGSSISLNVSGVSFDLSAILDGIATGQGKDMELLSRAYLEVTPPVFEDIDSD